MIISIENCKEVFTKENPIEKSRVFGRNNINEYKLLVDVDVVLSNGFDLKIPKGYIWDLHKLHK